VLQKKLKSTKGNQERQKSDKNNENAKTKQEKSDSSECISDEESCSGGVTSQETGERVTVRETTQGPQVEFTASGANDSR